MVRSFFEEKKNILAVFVGTILFFIYFFPYLGNTLVGFDTNSLINYAGSTNSWLDLGRYGSALLHKIFFQPQFSMFYAEAMALIFYFIALISYALLFHQIGTVSSWKSIFFFLICMIHPVWAEQFYYTLQIFDIAVGIFLVPLILYMTFQTKWIWWGSSIPILVLLFSIYQTFVIVYIAGCILCVLLLYFQKAHENQKEEKNFFLKLCVRQGIIFLIAFFINTIIAKLFFIHGTYLEGQIKWGTDSLQSCVNIIFSTAWSMFCGQGIFFTCLFAISFLFSAICIIAFLCKYKHKKEKWIVITAYLILQVCPLLLNLYLGNISVYRSLFQLPFVIACNILIILVICPKFCLHNFIPSIINISLVFMLLGQYYTTSLLQYTTVLVRQEDKQRAFAIEELIIQATGGSSKPVAFIGYLPPHTNGAMVNAEALNVSVFEFYFGDIPHYTNLTTWVTEYMKSQGIIIRGANAEQIIEARKIANNMSAFPLEGCVQELDDLIVVKLAPDDYFASEEMEADVNKFEMDSIPETSAQLNGYIDTIACEENVLTISGWVLEWQCNSSYVLPAVHLWDEDNNTLYSLSSGTQSRADLSPAFPDGTDYSHSGVLAKAELDQLPKDSLNHCRILLSTTRNGETKYFDTGKYVTDYLTDIAK